MNMMFATTTRTLAKRILRGQEWCVAGTNAHDVTYPPSEALA